MSVDFESLRFGARLASGPRIWSATMADGGSVHVTFSNRPLAADYPNLVEQLHAAPHPGLAEVVELCEGVFDPTGESARCAVIALHHDHRPLPQWLAQQPTPTITERLALLRMIASALDNLHAVVGEDGRRLAHGEVRPENVLVRPDGSAVLVNFAGEPGDLAYVATELSGRPDGERATAEGDAFAFALTVAVTLTAEPPPTRANGSLDVAALRESMRHEAIRRRSALRREVITVLTAPPEARPRLLRRWLDRAASAGSPPTVVPGELTAGSDPEPPAAAGRTVSSPHGSRRTVPIVAAVLILGAAVGLGVVLTSRNGGGRTAARGGTAGVHAAAVAWPLAAGCDRTTPVAMPAGHGARSAFSGADPRAAMIKAGAVAWQAGSLSFQISNDTSAAVAVTNLAPHLLDAEISAPVWVYAPPRTGATCHAPSATRRYTMSLDDMQSFAAVGASAASGLTKLGGPLIVAAHQQALLIVHVTACAGNYHWTLTATVAAQGADQPITLNLGNWVIAGIADKTDLYIGISSRSQRAPSCQPSH